MKNTIKCFVCGSTVKGSIRFEPYMKEKLGDKITAKEAKDVYQAILNFEVMPSMRALWAAGGAADADYQRRCIQKRAAGGAADGHESVHQGGAPATDGIITLRTLRHLAPYAVFLPTRGWVRPLHP